MRTAGICLTTLIAHGAVLSGSAAGGEPGGDAGAAAPARSAEVIDVVLPSATCDRND
jgi:hypothetical protein